MPEMVGTTKSSSPTVPFDDSTFIFSETNHKQWAQPGSPWAGTLRAHQHGYTACPQGAACATACPSQETP